MFEIGGNIYYFDLDKMSEFVRFTPNDVDNVLGGTSEDDTEKEEFFNDPTQMIDITKWEMIKALVETLLNDNAIVDDKLGNKGLESLTIPIKLSFNTLIKYKILKND